MREQCKLCEYKKVCKYVRTQMTKCIDQFDEHYDELMDEWQNYFDRFCTRVEELVKKGKKSSVRAVSVLTEAFGKESKDKEC